MSRHIFIAVGLIAALIGLAADAEAALEITTKPHPEWTEGVEYKQQLVASGGSGELSWSAVPGSPQGLRLEPSGILSGFPDQPGDYDFAILVSDSAGAMAREECSMKVNPRLAVATRSLREWTEGAKFRTELEHDGGTGSMRWSLVDGALPDGVTLGESGELSGKPSESGGYSFTVEVRDSLKAAARARIGWIVNDSPWLGDLSIFRWTVDCPMKSDVAVSGGTEPFIFALGNPDTESETSLPRGLEFKSSGRYASIVGIAQDTVKTGILITVTDACGAKAEGEYLLEIEDWVRLVSPELPGLWIEGFDLTDTFSALHGTPPYRFRIAGGELPTGLSLLESGVLSGKPTRTGAFSFAVEVVDSAGATADGHHEIEVRPAPEIVEAELPAWTEGVPFAPFSFGTTGGTGTPVWSAANALPAGMELTTGGALAGTPGKAGTFSFEVRATDPTGCETTRTFALQVNPAPVLASADLPDWATGRPYAQTIEAFGGTAPFAWSVAKGSFPPGLALLGDGHQASIEGVPSEAGHYAFTVDLRDRHGAVAERQVEITIQSVPGTHERQVEWTVGVYLAEEIAGQPTLPPYSFSVAGGEMPPGLELTSDETVGRITGTPDAPGTWELIAELSDAYGVLERWSVSVTIHPELEILETSALLAQGRDASYSVPIAGGIAPFTYQAIGASLPAGTTLDPDTGQLSGRPEDPGVYDAHLVVSDAAGAEAERTVTLHVAAPFPPSGRGEDTLDADEAVKHYFLEAGRGSRVDLTFGFSPRGEVLPALAILDAHLDPAPLTRPVMESKKGYRVKGWKVAETGRYFIRLDNSEAAFDGTVTLRSKVKPASRFSADGTLTAPDFRDVIELPVPSGSSFNLTLKATAQIVPDHLELVAPSGDRIQLAAAGRLESSGRMFKVSRLVLPQGGSYTMHVEIGGPADYSAKISLKIARHGQLVVDD